MASVEIPLAEIAGPQFLGICFNWALLGVLNLQVYLYYDYFHHQDPIGLKCLVYGVFIYEWVQTGLITAAAMQIYVYNYGSELALIEFHNTWFSATMMCGIISAVVQIFFAWRLYKLSKSRILAGVVVILALLQGIASLVCGAMEKSVGIASALQGMLLRVAILWLSGTVLVDVIIAVSMTTLLLRSKTGIASTDALINRMVRLVVETGTLTASLSIVVLITANIKPLHETLVYEAPALILTKMYSNTFLTNLNSREYLRQQDKRTIELMPNSMNFAHDISMEQGTTGYTSVGDATTPSSITATQKAIALGCTIEELQKRSIFRSNSNENTRARRNSIV